MAGRVESGGMGGIKRRGNRVTGSEDIWNVFRRVGLKSPRLCSVFGIIQKKKESKKLQITEVFTGLFHTGAFTPSICYHYYYHKKKRKLF